MTLPGAIVSGYFYNELYETELGHMILVLVDNITFSYHSLNFFVLLATNTKFRNELNEIFPYRCKIVDIKSTEKKSRILKASNDSTNTTNTKNKRF